MQFLCAIWKILHLTEYFYTGTAHGARNNYEVCLVLGRSSKEWKVERKLSVLIQAL